MGRAIVFTDVHQVELWPLEVGRPGPSECLVRIEYSAVSPGTELRCLNGKQADAKFPFVPGYACAGVIEEVGPGCHLAVGTRVLCDGHRNHSIPRMWGGHVSETVCNEASLIPVPDSVSLQDAALAKLASIPYRGFRMADPNKGEKVVVLGLGLIGLLSARIFCGYGCDVLALDLNPARLQTATASGLKTAAIDGDVSSIVHKSFREGPQIVVDATGNANALRQSLLAFSIPTWGIASPEVNRLVIQGSYVSDFALDYQEAFLREVSILLPRDTSPKDKAETIDLIANGSLKVEDLVLKPISPRDAPSAYESLARGEGITAVFDWNLI